MSTSKNYFDGIGAGWDRMQENFFSEGVRERAFQVAEVCTSSEGEKTASISIFVASGKKPR